MPKINDSYRYIYISNIFPQANMIKINVPMCILMNIIGILIINTYNSCYYDASNMSRVPEERERRRKKKRSHDRR